MKSLAVKSEKEVTVFTQYTISLLGIFCVVVEVGVVVVVVRKQNTFTYAHLK